MEGLEMYIKIIFELSLVLSAEEFKRLIKMADHRTERLDDNIYLDNSLASKGIIITYHDKQYKKKVQLEVELNEPEPNKLIRKLEERVKDYFHSYYLLNKFKLTRMSLAADIDVGNQEKVTAYLKVLQRIGKVKGFSQPSDNNLENDICFCRIGNSNGVEFCIYDLEGVLREQLSSAGNGRKELKNIIDRAKGLLQAKVWFTKAKAIRACTKEKNVSGQIADLTGRAEEVFLAAFRHIVPQGDHYKKIDAAKLIEEKVSKSKERRKMMRLLELIPEKRSLWLAIKAMKDRNIDEIIEKFAEIDVSPVTISKRHDVKHLKSLYSYLKN
jgi:hypothetical protein